MVSLWHKSVTGPRALCEHDENVGKRLLREGECNCPILTFTLLRDVLAEASVRHLPGLVGPVAVTVCTKSVAPNAPQSQ